jgi:hypothetical protein
MSVLVLGYKLEWCRREVSRDRQHSTATLSVLLEASKLQAVGHLFGSPSTLETLFLVRRHAEELVRGVLMLLHGDLASRSTACVILHRVVGS